MSLPFRLLQHAACFPKAAMLNVVRLMLVGILICSNPTDTHFHPMQQYPNASKMYLQWTAFYCLAAGTNERTMFCKVLKQCTVLIGYHQLHACLPLQQHISVSNSFRPYSCAAHLRVQCNSHNVSSGGHILCFCSSPCNSCTVYLFLNYLSAATAFINHVDVLLLQGLVCWLAMCRVQQALRNQYGSTCAKAFMIVTAMQFHLPFYMSRTLPNTFALAVLGLAIADWIEAKHPRRLVSLLAFATVRLFDTLTPVLLDVCFCEPYPHSACLHLMQS